MKGLPQRAAASKFHVGSSTDLTNSDPNSVSLDQKTSNTKSLKAPFWSSFFTSTYSIFESYPGSSPCGEKESSTRTHGWTRSVKRALTSASMKRFQERLLGLSKTGVSCSTSEKWLLGVCYKVSSEESSDGVIPANDFDDFLRDFSSRIWITYRRGFDPIGDSNFTSDVGWGCMLRSSQMLVAQALLFHHLGRSWRKPVEKPFDPDYIEILHQFGDSEQSAFSLHKLLQAGKPYGLAAGSWVGPYAVCCSWSTLARAEMEHTNHVEDRRSLPMALYVVSGDEDGERGGAPVIYIEHAAKLCSDFCKGGPSWAPILLLVPLVLGLDKINPRYIPLLSETFTFPQSLGILGGKPGASTYIVGVQDDNAFYLDPHEVQQVVDIRRDNLEADTSSYHCSVVRGMALNAIDPSLGIGFYCRDRDDFEDFCKRARDLADQSNSAPLFTVAQSLNLPKQVHQLKDDNAVDACAEKMTDSEPQPHEEDWQIL